MKFINPLLSLLISISLGACAPKSIQVTRSRLMMGHVPVNVTIRTSPESKDLAIKVSEEAYALADQIEKKISEYQPESEVSCLNRNAGKGFCALSPETTKLLKEGLDFSEKTNDAFDLRFASLSPAGRRGDILFQEGRARLQQTDTRIGVGSIGKGLILDSMIEWIGSKGFTAALVDAGGDLRALGGPWKVAIQRPGASSNRFATTFEIEDRALATSGNYEQPGHIRDPRTGEPVIRDSSVTVIADRHVLANGLSTAFYVMGEVESEKVLQKFPGVEMIWTFPDGTFHRYPHGSDLRSLSK